MDIVLLFARVVLAAIFLAAGVAKLLDLPGSRRAMRGFGLPEALAAPAGLLLPLAEIAVALALIPQASARWGALAALALLVAFCIGIAVNLARGETPDCHCFGQLHSEPVGWPTLARNGLLALVAMFVVWQGWTDPGRSAVAWMGEFSVVALVALVLGVVLISLLAVQGWLLLNLFQQNGRLLARVEVLESLFGDDLPVTQGTHTANTGLSVGTLAPDFQLPAISGETVSLTELLAPGKPLLLIFSDPGCGPCNALLPEIGHWQREEHKLTVALVSQGNAEANRAKANEHGIDRVLLQTGRDVASQYHALGTPNAVVVRPDGTIGSSLAQGAEQIRGLVARTTGKLPLHPVAHNGNGHAAGHAANGAGSASTAVKIGSKAPSIRLPGIDGKTIDLTDFRGTNTLVLFWNPNCGFCQRMLNELKAWANTPPAGAPALLVVSSGTPEVNRAQGLNAPIVLDQGFNVGRAFGATGTPSAVLVDAQGRVASRVVAGALAVMDLARTKPVGASASHTTRD